MRKLILLIFSAAVASALYVAGQSVTPPSPISPIGPINVPALGAFTQVGFTGGIGTASAISAGDGSIFLKFTSGASQTDQFASLWIPAPAAPFTYMIGYLPSTETISYITSGIGIRDSATGNMVMMDLLNTSTTPAYRAVHANQPNTGGGTFSASVLQVGVYPRGPVYAAIQLDSTNVTYYTCATANPNTCVQYFQESKTAYDVSGAFNQVGFYLNTTAAQGTINFMDVFMFARTQ